MFWFRKRVKATDKELENFTAIGRIFYKLLDDPSNFTWDGDRLAYKDTKDHFWSIYSDGCFGLAVDCKYIVFRNQTERGILRHKCLNVVTHLEKENLTDAAIKYQEILQQK